MRLSKKFIAFVLLFSLSCGFPYINAYADEASITNISANAACLIDADSKRILYSKNAEKRLPMASTTKIMTAILALECGMAIDTVISIPNEAVGIEGSSMYLRNGEKITLEALLYGLLLSSANDAAVAIAITVSGNVDNFVDLMNEKAQNLGLSNTHFTNPHGLYDKEHYTTALDLARLMAYCTQNELFLTISGCNKRVFQADESLSRVMINHNRLLRADIGVIAGKTGFTKISGRCLVTCAQNENLRLIAVTLNAPNDWQDHTKLYKFGFESYQRLTLDSVSLTLPVISGSKNEIILKSKQNSVLLPKSFSNITVIINAPKFVFGEITKNEQIGEVVYTANGKIIAISPLVASESIERIKYKFNLFEWLIDLIKGFLN